MARPLYPRGRGGAALGCLVGQCMQQIKSAKGDQKTSSNIATAATTAPTLAGWRSWGLWRALSQPCNVCRCVGCRRVARWIMGYRCADSRASPGVCQCIPSPWRSFKKSQGVVTGECTCALARHRCPNGRGPMVPVCGVGAPAWQVCPAPERGGHPSLSVCGVLGGGECSRNCIPAGSMSKG